MKPSSYDDWLGSVPPEITADALWQMTLYRQALFLGELAWFDVCGLAQYEVLSCRKLF